MGIQGVAVGGQQGGLGRARGSSAPSLEGAQQQVVVLDRGGEEDWSAGLPAWARGQEQGEGGPGLQWAAAEGPGGGDGGAGSGRLWVGFTGKSLHFGGLGGGEVGACVW